MKVTQICTDGHGLMVFWSRIREFENFFSMAKNGFKKIFSFKAKNGFMKMVLLDSSTDVMLARVI